MDTMIDVTIPVEPEAAAALADTRNRKAVSRSIRRVFSSRPGASHLAQAITALKVEVRQTALTDTEIDAELAAYNAERRDHRPET